MRKVNDGVFVFLQQLQSCGPLKYKLSSSLLKLQQEAEFILDLLNIAAEPDTPPQIEHSE